MDWLPEQIRGKVGHDLQMLQEGDEFNLDASNDYQLHLYGLWLRLRGWEKGDIVARLREVQEVVPERKVDKYLDWVIHSVIIGFQREDGSMEPVYTKVGG